MRSTGIASPVWVSVSALSVSMISCAFCESLSADAVVAVTVGVENNVAVVTLVDLAERKQRPRLLLVLCGLVNLLLSETSGLWLKSSYERLFTRCSSA